MLRWPHEKIETVISRLRVSALLLFLIVAGSNGRLLHASSTAADEQAGAVLFRDKGCAYCHGIGGVGGKKAPSLAGIRDDKMWTPARMTDQILNGGQKMPPFADSLTDQEIAQIIAYLRAKHRPVPPPAASEAPPPQ